MIVFITSVKHPENSKSYSKVCELLNDTLSSVCNQKDKNYRVIVVSNKKPSLHENTTEILKYTEFVEVEFPQVSQVGYEGIRIDRGSKYILGLVAARQYAPDYVMFFDADDYVGNDISEFANSHPGRNGWVINRGYILNGNMLAPVSQFNAICGTSNIFSYSLIMSEIDEGLSVSSPQAEVIGSTSEHYAQYIIGSHRFAEKYFRRKGHPLEYLPYLGAVYKLNTGENHSDFGDTASNLIELISSKQEWMKITKQQKIYFNIS